MNLRRSIQCLLIGWTLGGCGSGPQTAAPPQPLQSERDNTAKTPVAAPQKRELFAAVKAGELQAELSRKSYDGYVRGAVFIIDGGYQVFLKLTNKSLAPLKISAPRYLLARLPDNFKNPYENEAKTPDYAFFVPIPPDLEITVESGKTVTHLLKDVYYLGNSRRPPFPNSPNEQLFALLAAPSDSPYVKIAALAESARPPLTQCLSTLMSLVSDASPDESMRAAILNGAYMDSQGMRGLFDAAGIKPRLYGQFDEADKKYESIIAKLKQGLESKEPVLPHALDIKFCVRQREIALLASQYLRPRPGAPEGAFMGTNILPHFLAELDIRDTAVLNRIFEFALKDADEFSRMQAALAGVALDDARCIPILAQYMNHFEKEDGDVSQVQSQCTVALTKKWKQQGKYPENMKWEEALARFGGLDSTELKTVPPAELSALKALLDSGVNIRAGALEKLCTQARAGGTLEIRRKALERLGRSYKSNPKALELHLELIRGESDKGLRYQAVIQLSAFGKVPQAQPLLLGILNGCRDVKLERNEDKNLFGATLGALGRQQDKSAIQPLLAFLGRDDIHSQAVHECLREITKLSPAKPDRAAWEKVLREKGLIP